MADGQSKQEEPHIDQRLPRVEWAMQAYRICKDRLDRVKETVGQYLQGDNSQAGDGRPEAGGDGLAHPSRISSPRMKRHASRGEKARMRAIPRYVSFQPMAAGVKAERT
jgi:hypothetical protein